MSRANEKLLLLFGLCSRLREAFGMGSIQRMQMAITSKMQMVTSGFQQEIKSSMLPDGFHGICGRWMVSRWLFLTLAIKYMKPISLEKLPRSNVQPA